MTNTVLYITEPILSADDIGTQHCYLIHNGEIEEGELSSFAAHLQQQAVKVVLSAADTTLTQVTLNRKQARHMQAVLPFVLEESLLASPENLWFSYQTPRRGVSLYPVVVCNKSALKRLYTYFQQQQWYVTGVYVDAQLWQQRAPVMITAASKVLIVQSAYEALIVDEAQVDVAIRALELDSDGFSTQTLSEELVLELEQAIAQQQGINLLHSELPPMSTSAQQLLWQEWRSVVYFAATVLVAVWGLLYVQTYQYQQAAKEAQQQAVALYQTLFPQASRPQLLQREFENQLRRLQSDGRGESAFVSLMTPVATQLSGQEFERLQPLRFQFDERESSLSFDITAPEFAQIEKLRNMLHEQGMKVSIGNSRSADNGVTARLKVELAT